MKGALISAGHAPHVTGRKLVNRFTVPVAVLAETDPGGGGEWRKEMGGWGGEGAQDRGRTRVDWPQMDTDRERERERPVVFLFPDNGTLKRSINNRDPPTTPRGCPTKTAPPPHVAVASQ